MGGVWESKILDFRTFSAKAASKIDSEKKAKKVQKHGPTRLGFGLDFGWAPPPLRKEKQYINASIKCSRV